MVEKKDSARNASALSSNNNPEEQWVTHNDSKLDTKLESINEILDQQVDMEMDEDRHEDLPFIENTGDRKLERRVRVSSFEQ